jgi:F-type H+-transporting ATPase subunit a
VPTADLNGTLGMSIGVLLSASTTTSRSRASAAGCTSSSPPRSVATLLYPINFLMQMIEFLAKTVSHGMRLFGNMYAGELVFMLIALMGGAGTATVFLLRSRHRRLHLGCLPHPDRRPAGLHLHDADAGVYRPGPLSTTRFFL